MRLGNLLILTRALYSLKVKMVCSASISQVSAVCQARLVPGDSAANRTDADSALGNSTLVEKQAN